MGGPTGVGNGDLGREDLGSIDGGLGDAFAQPSNLADLLEKYNLALFVPINTDTSRVVTTILLTSKSVAKNFNEFLASLEMLQSDNEARLLLLYMATQGRNNGVWC